MDENWMAVFDRQEGGMEISRHFARFMLNLAGERCPELFLAAGLVSRYTEEGHVCLDLPLIAGRPVAEVLDGTEDALNGTEDALDGTEDAEGEAYCPELPHWIDTLRRISVVGQPGEFKPLILDDRGRLYLYRYWEYEKIVAESLTARAAMLCPDLDEALLQDGIRRLFPDPAGKNKNDGTSGNDRTNENDGTSESYGTSKNDGTSKPDGTNEPDGTSENDGTNEPDWQKIAAMTAVRRMFCVISGGPGAGKTSTVVKVLALLLEQARGKALRMALAAPTGKAAARLKESIRQTKGNLACSPEIRSLIPDEVSTIHRLLGSIRPSSFFRGREENVLPYDVVVVDEASMVDLPLMARLVRAVPQRSRLIILGDKDQLASVQAGAVLGDICGTGRGRIPMVLHSHPAARQARSYPATGDICLEGEGSGSEHASGVTASSEHASGGAVSADMTMISADPPSRDLPSQEEDKGKEVDRGKVFVKGTQNSPFKIPPCPPLQKGGIENPLEQGKIENPPILGGTEGGTGGGSLRDSLVILCKSYRFGSNSGIGLVSRSINEGDGESALSLLKGAKRFKGPANGLRGLNGIKGFKRPVGGCSTGGNSGGDDVGDSSSSDHVVGDRGSRRSDSSSDDVVCVCGSSDDYFGDRGSGGVSGGDDVGGGGSGNGGVGGGVNSSGSGGVGFGEGDGYGYRDIFWRRCPASAVVPEAIAERITQEYADYLKVDDPEEAFRHFNRFRVLCALRRGPYGADRVNALIEEALHRAGLIQLRGRASVRASVARASVRGSANIRGRHYRGQPVMITRNDYRIGLFNGDVGLILPDPSASGALSVYFPTSDGGMRKIPPVRLPDHESVYAMTVHKSQGSEFDRVLFFLPDMDAEILTRELIYTGITRARDYVEVWGREEVFLKAISRRIQRQSGLQEALWG